MIYNRNNFAIAVLAPGAERHYLDGIHITPEFTEVTNGHYLVRVSRPEGLEVADLPAVHEIMTGKKKGQKIDFILPASAAKEIEKAIPKNGTIPILRNAWLGDNTNEEYIEFISTDLETHRPIKARKIEAKYPNTEAVLPKTPPNMSIGFNPDLMIKLCQQFKKMKINAVKLDLRGITEAMALSGQCPETLQKIEALLMPIKIDDAKEYQGAPQKPKKQDPPAPQPQKPQEKKTEAKPAAPKETKGTPARKPEKPAAPAPQDPPKSTGPKAEPGNLKKTIRENKEKKGIEIQFSSRPEAPVRDKLKKNGFGGGQSFSASGITGRRPRTCSLRNPFSQPI